MMLAQIFKKFRLKSTGQCDFKISDTEVLWWDSLEPGRQSGNREDILVSAQYHSSLLRAHPLSAKSINGNDKSLEKPDSSSA